MIRSTAPMVSALAKVNAPNGPDLGLSIHWVATAARIMTVNIATIGWLRKKFLMVANSRSRRRVHPFAHSRANSLDKSLWTSLYGQGLRTCHVTLTEYVPLTS